MILDFGDEQGKRHFEFCFVGFILGGSLQEKKGMQVLRTEVGLYEKLEGISEAKPCGKKLVTGEPDRQLRATEDGRPVSPQMQLTLQEFDLLYNYLGQVPWQSGRPVKYAVETIDWLEKTNREARA
jgi:hypothetical protein